MVKDVTTVDGGQEKAKKKERQPFDIASAMAILPIVVDGKPTGESEFVSCINEDSQMFAVPRTIMDGDKISYQGWSNPLHKPIPKSNFADDATYLEYLGEVALQKGEKLLALSKERLEKAESMRKYGDKKIQKKAAKIEKMRLALAKMEAELEAEGLEVE